MSNIQSGRCYYLDLAKVITAFLVIYGHLFSDDSKFRLYLYAFHMPFFFLVSGIFHKYQGKINWGRYIKSILWPVAIFIGLLVTTNSLFYGTPFGEQLVIFAVSIIKGDIRGILWFLIALFWCKVFLDVSCGFKTLIIPFLIWVVLLFLPLGLKFRLPFELSNGMMAFPFYAVGFYCKDFFLKKNESIRWGIPFVVFLIIMILITHINGRVSMINLQFGTLEKTLFGDEMNSLSSFSRLLLKGAKVLLFYLNGFIGSFMILSLSLMPIPKTSFITSLSKSLITVLGTQSLFVRPITQHLGYDNGYLLSSLLSVGIFLLCFALHKVLLPAYTIINRHK